MELEGTEVFGRGVLQSLGAEKVIELADVIGVSVDGCLGQIADFHVLGHAPGDLGESVLIGRHVFGLVRLKRKRNPCRTQYAQRGSKAQDLTTETTVTSGHSPIEKNE